MPPSAAVRDLAAMVAIPSVSSDPARAYDVRRCAQWVAERTTRGGFPDVEILPGRRHPIVVAADRRAPHRPTALLYGHYDVQPAGPRSAWTTPPFTPVVRSNDMHGRGASDDKGQLLCEMLGVEQLRSRNGGRLPLNVVLIADGEEEIGSPTLPHLLAKRLPRWRPSAAFICDTRMLGPGGPALTVGLRGSLALELEVAGPRQELHSGHFGGAIHNPLQVLCETLAQLHNHDGRIAVPGLYADVLPPPPRTAPQPPDTELLSQAGVPRGWGERGYTAYERVTVRPSLTIAGATGGHQGPGVKGVIPATATAKLSLRLVPDQSPPRIERLIRAHLETLMPPTVSWKLRRVSASRPVQLDTGDLAHGAATRACRRVWARPPVALRSGGSIPLVELLARRHRIPTALIGFALPDDHPHAPNERFHLPHLQLGARTIAAALQEVATSAIPTEPRPSRTGEPAVLT